MALTGRFTFRRSFGGRIILQVEEEVKTFWPRSKTTPLKKRWRDATLMDLAAPELRALIDLRYKPQFMAQYEYSAPETPRQTLQPEGHDLDNPTMAKPMLDGRRSGRRLFGREVAVEVDRTDGFNRRSGGRG